MNPAASCNEKIDCASSHAPSIIVPRSLSVYKQQVSKIVAMLLSAARIRVSSSFIRRMVCAFYALVDALADLYYRGYSLSSLPMMWLLSARLARPSAR